MLKTSHWVKVGYGFELFMIEFPQNYGVTVL